MEEFRHEAGKS